MHIRSHLLTYPCVGNSASRRQARACSYQHNPVPACTINHSVDIGNIVENSQEKREKFNPNFAIAIGPDQPGGGSKQNRKRKRRPSGAVVGREGE
jgi:hypothetical protein